MKDNARSLVRIRLRCFWNAHVGLKTAVARLEAEPTSSAMTNLGSLFSTGVPQKSVISIAESRKKMAAGESRHMRHGTGVYFRGTGS
jgi:hypothetical protein